MERGNMSLKVTPRVPIFDARLYEALRLRSMHLTLQRGINVSITSIVADILTGKAEPISMTELKNAGLPKPGDESSTELFPSLPNTG